MRVLSLGAAMPGVSVDNCSFANASAFFDYDAIIVDPAALSMLIQEVIDGSAEHKTRAGERIINGSSQPGAVGLADLLRDRRDETARLLARRGIVVCFAQPNVRHERVVGLDNCDRYTWLPAPEGVAYSDPFLRRGDGGSIGVTEDDHPFAPAIERFRSLLAYRAYADDALAPDGLRVFSRSAGGAAIGFELPVGGGVAAFLPSPVRPLTPEQRHSFSQTIQAGIQRTLRLAAASSPPAWLEGYALPGLGEAAIAREEARQRVQAAQEGLGAAGGAVEALERYQRLLWQEGKYGLEESVRQALALIGLPVKPDELDMPATIRPERRDAVLLEVEASIEAVGLDGHYRLRRRIEESIAQRRPKRGLLIINGWRTRPPSERPAQYDESLRIAAERMRYGIVTTEQLFQAVRAALSGDDASVAAFRERLLSAEGVLQID
jgi:hypothetical protein